ncbi:MAG: ClpXP protease specificity-enhancing factor [Thiolinea sp.]
MIPKRPYLLRAFYDWIVDNNMTPHILVNALAKDVNVPRQHIKDGKIVLNISPSAVHDFMLDNDALSFSARFGGVAFYIYCPVYAIEAIYARESPVDGVSFAPDEYPDIASDQQEGSSSRPTLSAVDDSETGADNESDDDGDEPPPPRKRPSLRVVK